MQITHVAELMCLAYVMYYVMGRNTNELLKTMIDYC
jgi:hypothetical protein